MICFVAADNLTSFSKTLHAIVVFLSWSSHLCMDWLQFTHIWYYSLTKFRAKFEDLEAKTWWKLVLDICVMNSTCTTFLIAIIYFLIPLEQLKQKYVTLVITSTDICVKLCFWRPLFGVPYSFFFPSTRKK